MSTITILHNPRCSKSRETLNLLKEKGIEPDVREYLKAPLSEAELRALFVQLELSDVKDMMRTKEPEFKDAGLNNSAATDDACFKAMVTTPKLMERPVVIAKQRARIGRPPEAVLDIL